MMLTGGGVVIAALALCHACGMFSLSPALSISLLLVMAVAMVGAAVAGFKADATKRAYERI
jgi:hypothetical protein